MDRVQLSRRTLRESRGAPGRVCCTWPNQSGQVVAVGVNCTAPGYVESLIAEVASATTKPIVVYPNSGDGWDANAGRWIEASNVMRIGSVAPNWRRAGARIIGGCCRTTPDDIAEIRVAMQMFR